MTSLPLKYLSAQLIKKSVGWLKKEHNNILYNKFYYKSIIKNMYQHTNDIAKDVAYVNVSYRTVKIFHRRKGLISCPLYYLG